MFSFLARLFALLILAALFCLTIMHNPIGALFVLLLVIALLWDTWHALVSGARAFMGGPAA